MSRLQTTVAGAVLGAVIVALPTGALAARPNAAGTAIATVTKQLQKQVSGRAIAFGTLTATGTNSATITTPSNNSLTVPLAPKARFVAHSAAAAAQGYKTGDQVVVNGVYHNGFLGIAVVYDTVPFATPFATRVAGKVTTSSAQSLTVTTAANKSVTVQFGAQTRYFTSGKGSTTAPTYTANEKVTILAQQKTDGSFLARIVATGTLQVATKATVRAAGTISALTAGNASFTLTLKNGKSVTVTIAPTTRFRVNGKAATTAPTLTANEQVVAWGIRSTDAAGNITIAAKLINVKVAA